MSASGKVGAARARAASGVAAGRKRHDVVAGLSRAGSGWSLVVVRLGNGAQQARVLHAGTHGANEAGAIRRELTAHKATLLVRVLPTRETVGRVVQVPVAGDADLARAMRLIVEAETPPNVPAHRVGAAYLPALSGTTTRGLLLTGWTQTSGSGRGESGGAAALDGISEGMDERYCTPLGALVALRGSNDGAIVDARESEQAISVLLSGPERTMARVVVDEPGDDAPWPMVVEETLRESAEAVGLGAMDASVLHALQREAWPAGRAGELAQRVSGASVEPGWLGMHAWSLGAALAGQDDGGSGGAGGLASIRAEAPRVHLPVLVRAVQWASVPARAWGLAVAAVLAMLLVPWGLSYVRMRVLQTNAKDLAEVGSRSKDVELKAALYQQVGAARWPMTKLLADIAGAAPVGLTIKELRATVGQNVTLEGEADARETVTQFESNLNATRLFSSVTQRSVEPKGEFVEFTYQLSVGPGVHAPAKPVEDFAAKSLAVRLYGEGASNTLPPKGAAPAPVRTRGGSGTAVTPTVGGGATAGGNRGASGAGESRRPSASSGSGSEAPAEIKDEEIATLSRSEAMKAWAERRRYLQSNLKADPSIRTRVEEEATKLRARMDQAAKTETKEDKPAGGGGTK